MVLSHAKAQVVLSHAKAQVVLSHAKAQVVLSHAKAQVPTVGCLLACLTQHPGVSGEYFKLQSSFFFLVRIEQKVAKFWFELLCM